MIELFTDWQRWTDYRLAWNESEYDGMNNLPIQATQIWLPDVFLFNRSCTLHNSHCLHLGITLSHMAAICYNCYCTMACVLYE